MPKPPSVFECQSCGHSSAKWMGRCPDCGGWNTFVEEKRTPLRSRPTRGAPEAFRPVSLSQISTEKLPRICTLDPEFDRVLGGGIVPGSLVLLGGEPGIGKSTLLLQMSQNLQAQGRRVLYVSGEESAQQIKMRAERLLPVGEREGSPGPAEDTLVLPEANLERILAAVADVRPTDLVIDSVQTTFSELLDSAPGSISQVRHVATQLLNLAKTENIPVFLVGHVTKDGSLAGPKALEHIVDAVLYFEGEQRHNLRIVRAVKNRFGAANEVGVFEMTARGLTPVQNPSNLFLWDTEAPSAGSAVVSTLQGTRAILAEIQALVSATQYSTARRVATGLDYNRISVLVAMLERRLGFHLIGCDIYVNAAGGLEIAEPAADLAIVAAILSSFRNRPLTARTVVLGELGLAGEVRPISQVHPRVREAAAMGFGRCILPGANLPLVDPVEGLTTIPVRTISEAAEQLFGA